MGQWDSIAGARLAEESGVEDVDSLEAETNVSTTPAPDHKKPRVRCVPPSPANYL
jgi:hypothetical protein